ncbi:hypothetical protein IAT38_000799 [Cryptococcus sp. DSM 104549]
MAPFPGLGDDIKEGIDGAVNTVKDGAGGAANTVKDGAGGAVATATEGAGNVVASATSVASDIQDQINNASGLLKWMDELKKWITKLEGYWNEYKNWIIFSTPMSSSFSSLADRAPVFALIVTIYILSILYCCYHCFHDFCRCCCCYIKCTYRTERWCWRTCGPCCMRNCKSCCNSIGKRDFHACSRCCVRAVPEGMRKDLEKQHGDLRKGWCDATYVGRACGRYELPDDPVERAKWHWWGHEEGWVHLAVENTLWCLGTALDKEKRLAKELGSAEKRDKYFTKLSNGVDKLADSLGKTGGTAGEWTDRVNRQWAQSREVAHLLTARMSREEKALLARAKKRLRKEKRAKEKQEADAEKGPAELDSDTTLVGSDYDEPAARRL